MKQTLLLVLSLFSFSFTYAQFPQNFEDPSVTVPNGFPAGWLVTDNGVGTSTNWTINNNNAAIISGTKSAFVDRYDIGTGNTSEDWLISPSTVIPVNGQLRFFARQTLPSDNGTLYQIRVSSGPTQSDLSSYTVLQQWTEAEMNQIFDVVEQKVVNFPFTLFGTNVHIAFVRMYTQTTAAAGGDRWLIDDINVEQKCLNPSNIGTNNITATSAQLFWNGSAGALGYEIELLPASQWPTGVATNFSETTNFFVTGLIPNICYKYYVRSSCGNGNSSEWVGPVNFCTPPLGQSCNAPILIPTLPYQTTNNTSNFGNTLAGPQPNSCSLGSTNYQAGNDVFYSYTATENCMTSFKLNSNQPGSSLFIFSNCFGNTSSCLAAVGNATNNERVLNFAVVAGTTYIIAISSSALSPTIAYDLIIQCENCTSKPTNLTVSNVTLTGADLAWTAPGPLPVISYQVAVQLEGSSVPSGSGNYTGITNPFFSITNLTSGFNFQYWVRSECEPGIFSAWVGPKTFDIQSCPHPQNVTSSFVTPTSVALSWNELGSASQWEVYVTAFGNPAPINGTPLNTNNSAYVIANSNSNFVVSNLDESTSYQYYVRSICSSTDLSTWTAVPNSSFNLYKLVGFVDSNSNGVKDTGESNLNYGNYTFQKNNNGIMYYVEGSSGSAEVYNYVLADTYDFNFEINSEYAAYYAETPTNFNDIGFNLGVNTQTFYFPITVTQAYNDVEVSITPLSVPRPGFSYTHKIIYKNRGHDPTSGTITYTKSNANIAITSTVPIATTTTSNGFTYDYSNLLPGETRSILVNMLVATIPTVNLGDVVTNTASITSDVSEVTTTNNTFSTTQIVVGSYDPNDKNEARGSNVQIGQFTQDDYLFYTIRFQNSGTASAETVRIEDALASQFDFSSIRMISASHNYTMQRITNNVVWTFNNINLPSENQDEPGSHGYVTFKIKLNPGFAVGDVIENTAEIYFDFNPAITTNTFQTTFVPNLSTGSFDASQLVIYPNPAKEMVQVSMTNSTETLSKIVIYDMIGKAIKSVSGNKAQQATVNVSDLSSGVYMIEITTNADLKQIRKFIIN